MSHAYLMAKALQRYYHFGQDGIFGRPQAFINAFRLSQQANKPRLEIFLVPGATPGDLKGSKPFAWRAIQGHSGDQAVDPEAMGWPLITEEEAPHLWHGTAYAYMAGITKYGLIPCGVGGSRRKD